MIIPAFNEAANLPGLLQRCQSLADWDVLVVNDGSHDNTAQVLAELGARHVNLPLNLGIGGAVQTGYRYAKKHQYQYAAQIDGDGQHDPEQLLRLVPYLAQADCVIGSRFLERQGYQSTRLRLLGIGTISWVLYLLTRQRIYDCTSGMRVVNREVIELFNEYYPCDYPEPESLTMLIRSGRQVLEVPVVMKQREQGRSSIFGFKSVLYMLQVIPKIVFSALFRRYTWKG